MAKKQNKKLENKKAKWIKKEKMPIFLLIGILLICISIILFYYIGIRYAPVNTILYGGYGIEAKKLTQNLKSENFENIDASMNLLKVEEQETVYKRLNNYYIGGNEKKGIDLNYPIYINEKSALYNLSEDTKLITQNFEKIEGYPNFTLSEGKMYNSQDLTRADGNEYIFIETPEGIYITGKDIKITTNKTEYEIPTYSILYFTENHITYYTIEGERLIYHNILEIDKTSQITIQKVTEEENMEISYEELLLKLGIIQEEVNILPEVEEQQEENTINIETIMEGENQEPSEETEQTYIKPIITASNFEAGVYTARTNIEIQDPQGRILGATFIIRRNNRIYQRRQITGAGNLELTSLVPDTEFEVEGTYIYLNENNNQIEETFYQGEFTTKSIDTLGSIYVQHEPGQVYSNKIEIKNFYIENEATDEVLKGISRIEIEIDGIQYRLSNEEVANLKNKQTITYQTNETVTSNKNITYRIHMYDKDGNEFAVENAEGRTKTAKQAPTLRIQMKTQEVGKTEITLNLNNKDNVELENYHYVITNASGDEIRESLEQNQKEIERTDLNPNSYYNIKFYADYDLEDGTGIKREQLLLDTNFTTMPLASLGQLFWNTEAINIEQNKAEITIQLDEIKTDKRLIQIIHQSNLKITDENGKEFDTYELDVNQIKANETITISLQGLNSNTEYHYEIITTVKQGSVEENIGKEQTQSSFITRKKPAEVIIKNQFVTGELIDFDVAVQDEDGSILLDYVRMEIRDEKSNLISVENITKNQEDVRKQYDRLEPNQNYTITFIAEQYNEGRDNSTYQANYVLETRIIYTEINITGELELHALSKKGTGKNLINVESKNNWFGGIYFYGATGGDYGKEYNAETGELKIGTETHAKKFVYDFTEYIGQEVTISFEAMLIGDETNYNVGIQNHKESSNRMKIENLSTSEYKEYQYTVTIDETGYLGFYTSVNQWLLIKNLQVELGNRKSSYEPFSYQRELEVGVNLEDRKEEITTRDYYIRLYENGSLIQEERYEEIENGKVENAVKKFQNLKEGTTCRIELLVNVRDRFYILDYYELEIEAEKEIKAIRNEEEYREIQPYGEYVVVNDLDFSQAETAAYFYYGTQTIEFEGKVDFNGHSVYIEQKWENMALFNYIGEKGRIENIVINLKLGIKSGYSYWGFFNENKGTIRNFQINLLENVPLSNSYIYLIGRINYGIIDNFVVHLQEPLYGLSDCTAGVWQNRDGAIQNGYFYGENIKAYQGDSTTQPTRLATACIYNYQNGMVRNIYSLVNVDLNIPTQSSAVSNIVYSSYDSASVQNIYSVGIGQNITNFTRGPNIWSIGNNRVENNYYFCDEIFSSSYHTKTTMLALRDINFQNNLLNTQGQFEVDELVSNGYYPHVIMPEVMPRQEYIELPEVEDEDLADILSIEVLEQKADEVTISCNIHNPSGEQIVGFQVESLNTEILSQEYADGVSKVKIKLNNPSRYISGYSVMSITTQGAFGNNYTRNFEENERILNIELFRPINNIEDWKQISVSPNENYMLMQDLDFMNYSNDIRINTTFRGKLNGNGHTVKNINTIGAIFPTFYGTLTNINFENITMTSTYPGIINNTNNQTKIQDVHINKMNIIITTKNANRVGAIVSFLGGGSIQDCSVRDLNVQITNGTTSYVGGIVGYTSGGSIKNCYVQNAQINISNVEVSYGIGGIAGTGASFTRIENCYTQGEIISNTPNIGGIIGVAQDSSVLNCYSLMNLESMSNFIGGIIGQENITSSGEASGNLALGDIYQKSNLEYPNRIIGSENDYTGNYAYNRQRINGFISNDVRDAILLSKEQLSNSNTYTNILNWGNAYDYRKVEEGILPKLYYADTQTLLPYQEDIFIEEESNLNIEEIEVNKGQTNLTGRIVINNPNQLEITQVRIEDMESNITKQTQMEGKTYIEFTGTPTRYYDSYQIYELVYEESGQEKIQKTSVKIEAIFYKELYTYEDWQQIETDTYQNYRLMEDIDFAGRTNIKSNVSMGRFESDGNKKLTNITIQTNSAEPIRLIQSIQTNLENITFENITLTNTSKNSVPYNGVIGMLNANAKNITFKNITVDAPNQPYTGLIGMIQLGEVEQIILEDITIKGYNNVGGFTGRIDNASIENLDAKNVIVEASGEYSGGIVGYQTYYSEIESRLKNINANSINITGADYVGGILGYGKGCNITIEESNITGNSYVGGIVGSLTQTDSNISGTEDISYLKSYNNTIQGSGEEIRWNSRKNPRSTNK